MCEGLCVAKLCVKDDVGFFGIQRHTAAHDTDREMASSKARLSQQWVMKKMSDS